MPSSGTWRASSSRSPDGASSQLEDARPRPGRKARSALGPRRRAMTTQTLEELGPGDIVVIGYPAGAPMTGSAATALLDEVDKGTINVLDAMFVTKNEDGTYSG